MKSEHHLLCQIFTLSALPLDRMPKAIKECFAVLKPGGLLLFRDYGNSNLTDRYSNWEQIHRRVFLVFVMQHEINILLFVMIQVFMI